MRRSQYRLFSRLASFPWMCPECTDTYSKRNQDFVALEPPADDPFLKAFTTDDEPPTVHSMDESQIERNINKYLTMKEDLTPRSAPSTGPGSSIVDIFDFPDEEPERVDPNLARYMNRRNRVVKENHFMYNTVYGTASSSSVFTNGPAPGTCHFQSKLSTLIRVMNLPMTSLSSIMTEQFRMPATCTWVEHPFHGCLDVDLHRRQYSRRGLRMTRKRSTSMLRPRDGEDGDISGFK